MNAAKLAATRVTVAARMGAREIGWVSAVGSSCFIIHMYNTS